MTQEGDVASDRTDSANVKFVHNLIPLFPDSDSEATKPRPDEDHDIPTHEKARSVQAEMSKTCGGANC